ncbi:MAG: GerMN domain-containing protein, partial [Clostridia bacterium]|nr:GerMN domain-containing protein [Clostridia bacterium]
MEKMIVHKLYRFGLLFLLLCLFQTAMTGCAGDKDLQPDAENTGFYVYYINKAETKVVAVPYELQSDSTEEQIMECLAVLESVSDDTDLKRPISSKTNVLDYYLDEEQLVIDFDENYLEADRGREVLCRAAIVRTLTQIKGVECVSFLVSGNPLLDANEQPISVMTAETFIDHTGDEINSYEKARLTLYFANESRTALIAEQETVTYSSNISMEKLVAEHIIQGPAYQGYYPTVSPNTKQYSIVVKDGICYVNLSEDFLTLDQGVTEDLVVYSLVNSLTELPNINKVQI